MRCRSRRGFTEVIVNIGVATQELILFMDDAIYIVDSYSVKRRSSPS